MSTFLPPPWIVAFQVPLSMGFYRQEYWSGLHSFLQGIFPDTGIELCLSRCLHCQVDFFLPLAPPRKPIHYPISSPKSVLISYMQACMLSHFSRVWVLWPYGPWSARLLCPWDSPGKNSGVGGHVLLQGIFLIQGLNLPSCVCSIDKQVLYHYHHLESPLISQK